MSEPKSFAVSSDATAAKALDYFNGFHDGFMKRIMFTSQDQIERDLSQACTGVFDVEIDFAHYNYPRGIARHSVESSGSRVTHSTTPFSV